MSEISPYALRPIKSTDTFLRTGEEKRWSGDKQREGEFEKEVINKFIKKGGKKNIYGGTFDFEA